MSSGQADALKNCLSSATVNKIFFKKSAFFWDITQRTVAVPYRRFGTTYRSHFHGSRYK